MKNKILLLIVVVLFIIYIRIEKRSNKETPFFDYELVIKDLSTNKSFNIKLEDYLIGVLAGEMPTEYNLEALKAQAVASRTYALYKKTTNTKDYDLTTDNTTQVYLTNEQMHEKWQNNYQKNINKIKKAINDTKGEIITYDDKIISAYYFSLSNGYTEDGKTVFNEDKPYLKSVSSPENTKTKNFTREKTFTKKEFCNLLSLKDCSNISIDKITVNETHHVSSIIINSQSFEGTIFRKKLKLYSTDFIIDNKDNQITITCNGNGHGVGLSQVGANILAQNGYNYEAIIKHYYTGVKIQKNMYNF